MDKYEVFFSWQAHDRSEVVSAASDTEAKKVIEARYPGARIKYANRTK